MKSPANPKGPGNTMTLTLDGYGHSDETYEKSGGRWRVETSTSTRLREDIATPLFSIHVSEHIGNAGTGFARKSAGRPSGKA